LNSINSILNKFQGLGKKRLFLIVGLATLCLIASIGSYLIVGALMPGMSAKLNNDTVKPSPSPVPTQAPVSNDVISAAVFDGVTCTDGLNTNSISFPDDSSFTVGEQGVTLSITVSNTGTGPSVINPSTGVTVSGYGTNGILTFTLTSGSSPVTIPAGGTSTFTWNVNPISVGTATPTVSIQQSS
jgi:hypothetical protein